MTTLLLLLVLQTEPNLDTHEWRINNHDTALMSIEGELEQLKLDAAYARGASNWISGGSGSAGALLTALAFYLNGRRKNGRD